MILFFQIFKNIFYQHFYESKENLNQLICIRKGRLNVPNSIWPPVDAVVQTSSAAGETPPPPPPLGPDYKTPINGYCLLEYALIPPSETCEFVV